MKRNVTIIIPAFNEEATLEAIVEKVLSLEFAYEVIVVDDHSSDQTPAILESLSHHANLTTIRHESNKGKTAAIKTALSRVSGEIVVIQDADQEYDPGELVHVCEPIWKDLADVVYGSRFLVRKASRVLYFYHYIANKGLTFICNLFTNKNMTDVETCYKAFRAPLLTNMPITSSGFGFEIEVTSNVSRTRARIYETPISYYGRTYEEGKKISFLDGVAALWYILKFNVTTARNVKEYVTSSDAFLSKVTHQKEKKLSA